MQRGYIYLWRRFLDAVFYRHPFTTHLAVHLLLRANHKEKEAMVGNQVVLIGRGQLIAGRETLSNKTGLSEQQVRTALKKLQIAGFLTIKSTNKFSIITICKYNLYQNKESYLNQQPHPPASKNQPIANQPATTNNKDNNGNNEKEDNANFVYGYYKRMIRNGAQVESVFNIAELLKAGHTKEQLIKTVDKYKEQINREGIEDKFRTQANNFFKQGGRFMDYVFNACLPVLKINPNCHECHGTGKVYAPGSGKNVDCFVCEKAT